MDHIAQERPIVLADFFRYQIIEQSIHAKHEVLMLLGLKGQVVRFFRVALEMESDPVAGNRINGREGILGSGKKPVSPLVNDDEDNVVGRLGRAGGGFLGGSA